MRRLSVLLVASLLLTACGNGQQSDPTSKFDGSPFMERGINLYVCNDPSVDNSLKLSGRLDTIFNYMIDLNANAVALYFPIFTDGPTGSTVSVGEKTPSTVMLEQIIRAAHARNLKVKLRPSIDPNNLTGTWHGAIQPKNRDQWFASYASVLKPYAALARETGVSEFQVATELDSLEGDPRWKDVLATLQSVYRRTLSYAVHWELLDNGTAKPPTDVYGISAYPPISLPDDASVADLAHEWGAWLDKVGTQHNLRRLVLDEVGIPGAKGAYKQPWSWDNFNEQPDPEVQAKWFTAACTAARMRNMPGVYFWKLDLFRDPHVGFASGELVTQFAGRPGEAAIRTCFAA